MVGGGYGQKGKGKGVYDILEGGEGLYLLALLCFEGGGGERIELDVVHYERRMSWG